MNNREQKKTAPRAATPETESNNNITDNSIADIREKIKVVVQHPGEISRIVSVPDTLEALQKLVGGYIEVVSIGRGLLLVLNEEGRLRGMKENVRCVQYGTIVGTVFVTAADGDEFRSLTTEEIQTARAWLLRHTV